jgi:hypothetical protein
MSLCPGVLWLTLNLVLIIQRYQEFFFNFTNPLRRFRIAHATLKTSELEYIVIDI